MKGLIALVGAGEYLPVMDAVDRHLLASVKTDGRPPQVVCLPTAAGQEGESRRQSFLRADQEITAGPESHFDPVAKGFAVPIPPKAGIAYGTLNEMMPCSAEPPVYTNMMLLFLIS